MASQKISTVFERNAAGNALPLSPQLIKVECRKFAKASIFPLHSHPTVELILPLRGLYKCTVNGSTLDASPGQAIFIQQNDTHEDFYQEGSKVLFLIYTFYDLSGRLLKHGVVSGKAPVSTRMRPIQEGSLAYSLMKPLLADALDANARMSLGEALLWQIISELPPESLEPGYVALIKQGDFKRRVSAYFQRCLAEGLNVEKMATAFGLSKRMFEYNFRRDFKESPAHAFMACRMRMAVQLLEQGCDVKDVAGRLGFSSQFYFSTAFKRVMGYPPSMTSTGLGKGRALRKNE